jgi:parallel beta-helix repeat protein
VGIALWDTGTTFNRIEGNFAGLAPNGSTALPLTQSGILLATNSSGNTVGGTTFGAGNLVANCAFEGIGTFKSTGNSILGNSIGRTTTNLAAPVENGILLNDTSNNNEVRTNVVFRARKQGINLFKSSGNTVQGNIIGFAADQLTAGGFGDRGILINELSHNNVIGGTGSGQGNRIGNGPHGVGIFNSNGSLLQGNIIGVNANNVRAPITGDGIGIYNSSSENRVGGGTVPGRNVIRGASRGVVVLGNTSLRNSIRVNSISGSAALGIDLIGTGGVTSNDNTDADVGPNGLTNFPQILGLVFSGGNLTVNGALAAKPTTAYTIDVYYSSAADASGFGEGEVWVSAIPVMTNSVGTVTFSQIINTIPAGTHVSMTATGPEGTSEFCRSAPRT